MNTINWILNIACIFLWMDWRSGRTGRPHSALSIASALRATDQRRGKGLGSLVVLAAILLIRPWFYHSVGAALNWTASLNFLAISIPWRSDLLSRMYAFSTLSFSITLGFYYSWLLLLSAMNRGHAALDDTEVMHRFVRGQLAWLALIPWWLKLFLPSIAAGLSWMGLAFLFTEMDLIPEARTTHALWGQAGAFAIAALLSWKWFLIAIFLLHMLNIYVYLGSHPAWAYLSSTARKLLFPFTFLQIGKIDLSPIAGSAAVLALSEFLIEPLVVDIFRRYIS